MTDLLLNPAEAARRLGTSFKALRLYEDCGLLKPQRNAAGWRFYGAAEMARAQDIVSLRALGLSLAQVGRVLSGMPDVVDDLFLAHQAQLDRQMAELGQRRDAVGRLRAAIARGQVPEGAALSNMTTPKGPAVRFDLPWPWAGEAFEVGGLSPLTFLTGPLGSGKTRLAQALAKAIPGAVFSGMERLHDNGAAARQRIEREPILRAAIAPVLQWLLDDGAVESGALLAVLVALCDPDAGAVVMDLVEDGLDERTQEALAAWLRLYNAPARPLILMTRSSAILDLETAPHGSMVLYCPANHSPPRMVLPVPGAAGYEAVASCLAAPAVRERTAGLMAVMP